jgi:uracil-DNA glycosylase
MAALVRVRVLLALGAIAWEACLGHLARTGRAMPSPRPRFGHGRELVAPGGPALVGSYHVSRQNTQTGRLTPAMFDAVLRRVVAIARR